MIWKCKAIKLFGIVLIATYFVAWFSGLLDLQQPLVPAWVMLGRQKIAKNHLTFASTWVIPFTGKFGDPNEIMLE